jgi:hypothetical protein
MQDKCIEHFSFVATVVFPWWRRSKSVIHNLFSIEEPLKQFLIFRGTPKYKNF